MWTHFHPYSVARVDGKPIVGQEKVAAVTVGALSDKEIVGLEVSVNNAEGVDVLGQRGQGTGEAPNRKRTHNDDLDHLADPSTHLRGWQIDLGTGVHHLDVVSKGAKLHERSDDT